MRFPRHLPQLLALAVCVLPAFAQDPNYTYAQSGPNNGGFQQDAPPPPPPPGGYQQQAGGYPHFPDSQQSAQQNMQQNMQAPEVQVPSALTIPAGKYLTVRTTGWISSDRNQPGDFFSATLTEPLVVDGFVVAARGQTVNGRVTDVEKAGRVKGTSSLRMELTELNLVDGQQIPFKSQMVYRKGETSVGRDAAGIGTTTAVGAAIGAGVGGGFGAGMGAIGGAVVGTLGVLVTRGRPTVVGPESLLTFRVDQPLTISTVRSPAAFAMVDRRDYSRPQTGQGFAQRPYGYGYAAAPYPYYGYPYVGTGFYFGPRFYYGYRGGFYGRRW